MNFWQRALTLIMFPTISMVMYAQMTPRDIHLSQYIRRQVINSSFWVHTLCPHLNITTQHKHETRLPVLRRHKFILFLVWDFTVHTALYFTSSCTENGNTHFMACTKLPWEYLETVWNMLYVQHCMPLAFFS